MYVKALNGTILEFPYTIADLRKENPSTSFPNNPGPQILDAYNVYAVTDAPVPSFDSKTHRVIRGAVNQDGQWVTQWTVERLSEADAADNVRGSRNHRLADCDWTQLPDAPVDHTAWASYRQALRDVTAQPGFPWNVEWPSQPA